MGSFSDVGFDTPKSHAIRRDAAMYSSFYAPEFDGQTELPGWGDGTYQVTDYDDGTDFVGVGADPLQQSTPRASNTPCWKRRRSDPLRGQIAMTATETRAVRNRSSVKYTCAVNVLICLLGVFALLSTGVTLIAEVHPSAEISNGLITAKIYLPDPDKGYYRGTRFDWSGAVYSLTYKGHEYFGEWQQSDDPYLHDRITGPVEEFVAGDSALGYDEAPVGGLFLRIGVGLCEKPQEDGYRRKDTYKVVDPGKWTIRRGDNWIEFVHEVVGAEIGYGYRYTKRLTLSPQSPELIIDHILENTGSNLIETSVYNHNFFVIDNQPTGPDFVVRFPFELSSQRDLKGYAEVRGNELAYLKVIPPGAEIGTRFDGYSESADDNRFTIENRAVKAGVRMTADKPISRIVFWSPNTTLCPEHYIDLAISAGQADRWTIRYEFYTLD